MQRLTIDTGTTVVAGLEFIERGGCALCLSREARVEHEFRDIPVLRCARCGFIYSARLLSPEGLSAYYSHGFGGDRHRRGQSVNACVNLAVLRRLLDIRTLRSVLDIGTGYGFFLHVLQRATGLTGVGVELSEQEARYARDELALRVIDRPLEESGLPRDEFDLVTAFEVIEHTVDPIDFLRQLRTHARPGGYLLIATDNFDGRLVRALGPAFPKWIPHAHISHLSYPTLRDAIGRAGDLEIVAARSLNPWEMLARTWLYRIRARPVAAADAFDLAATLRSEMGAGYAMHGLRRWLNPLWSRLALSHRMDGSIMYVLARRTR